MSIHIYKDPEKVTNHLAEWIVDLINKTLEVKESFSIALSGGKTPALLYKKLASSPYKEKIPWEKLEFFWGDERMISFQDDRNNAKMSYDNLLDKVNVNESQIHKIDTGKTLQKATEEYENLLHNFFKNIQTSFDLVLLGLGEDGHTLSIFPGSELLSEKNNWVNYIELDDLRLSRITLMPSIVNKASYIVFLVTGEPKEKILKDILEGQPNHYPSQLIQPISGELHWFVDESAAKSLTIK